MIKGVETRVSYKPPSRKIAIEYRSSGIFLYLLVGKNVIVKRIVLILLIILFYFVFVFRSLNLIWIPIIGIFANFFVLSFIFNWEYFLHRKK